MTYRVRCTWFNFQGEQSERKVKRFREFGRAYLYAKRRAFETLMLYTRSEAIINGNAVTVWFHHPKRGNLDLFIATIVDEDDDPKPERS